MRVSIYTDGAARGNPDGPGGYGTVLEYVDSKGELHTKELSQGYKKTTNNRMELMAVIAGLEALNRPCEVTLYSDSKYVVDAFNQHWIDGWLRKGWKRGKNEPVKIERIPLFGLQDVRREKGSLNDVLSRATEENKDDFVSVTLTDEKEIYNFREKLEEVYSHILEIKIENERTRKELEDDGEEIRLLSPLEAFDGFYQTVRCCPMSEEEKKIMEQIIAQWETEAE